MLAFDPREYFGGLSACTYFLTVFLVRPYSSASREIDSPRLCRSRISAHSISVRNPLPPTRIGREVVNFQRQIW